jgi:hypothetical protein
VSGTSRASSASARSVSEGRRRAADRRRENGSFTAIVSGVERPGGEGDGTRLAMTITAAVAACKGVGMTGEAFLRGALASVEVNDTFSEAVVVMGDGSRLCFCHRVGELWASADGGGRAAEVLAIIRLFRLNGKHLDVQFQDGSRWEARFQPGSKGQ